MTRNLKVLGLALAAVFALSAAIAASASAEIPGVITTDGTSVTLDGIEIGGTTENFIEIDPNGRIECPGSAFPGHKANTTPHEAIPNGATEITMTPTYNNCNIPIDMNGCDYDLKEATTTGGVAGTYGVKTSIRCPGTEKIKITTTPCTTLIPPQTAIGFHLTNTTGSPDDIVMSGVATESGTACGFPVTVTPHVNLTFKGTNSSSGATEVTLTHN